MTITIRCGKPHGAEFNLFRNKEGEWHFSLITCGYDPVDVSNAIIAANAVEEALNASR